MVDFSSAFDRKILLAYNIFIYEDNIIEETGSITT